MEERKAQIQINKAGGNVRPYSQNYRTALPSVWMKTLGITHENREVLLHFDGDSIVIQRPSPSEYNFFLEDARRKGHPLLILHHYSGATLRTKICADKTTLCLAVENLVNDPLSSVFGVSQAPTWEELQEFLESHCVPRQRDGLQYYLESLGLDSYDPLSIIRKTQGRMAEDDSWAQIVEG